jgi:hypothetical protein
MRKWRSVWSVCVRVYVCVGWNLGRTRRTRTGRHRLRHQKRGLGNWAPISALEAGGGGAKVSVYSGHHATSNTVNRPHLCLFFPPGPASSSRHTHTASSPVACFRSIVFPRVFLDYNSIVMATGYCCWHWSCFSLSFLFAFGRCRV